MQQGASLALLRAEKLDRLQLGQIADVRAATHVALDAIEGDDANGPHLVSGKTACGPCDVRRHILCGRIDVDHRHGASIGNDLVDALLGRRQLLASDRFGVEFDERGLGAQVPGGGIQFVLLFENCGNEVLTWER